eukprot:scaffold20757_cov80-Skeletonema_menzelii.AAC.1
MSPINHGHDENKIKKALPLTLSGALVEAYGVNMPYIVSSANNIHQVVERFKITHFIASVTL